MADVLDEKDIDEDEFVPVEVETMADELPAKEDDDDDEDERLAEDDDGEETESERSPTAKKRAKRREFQKRAKENAARELSELRARTQRMEQELEALRGSGLDTRMREAQENLAYAKREVQEAEKIISKAVEVGNGEDVTAAMRLRDEAKDRARSLEYEHDNMRRTREAPPAIDPRVNDLATRWMAANPWYDARNGDEDSRITTAIDSGLKAEGYDPASVVYWQELTRRVERRFGGPEDKQAETPSPRARGGPPVGADRGRPTQGARTEVRVTPERKQAMIDAGKWDDPKERATMLKAYAAYDRDSAR